MCGPSVFITGVNMSQVNRDALATMLRQFRKQSKPSINSRGACSYRGDDNTKCAAGCLIPDEIYFPGIEICSLQDIFNRFFDKRFKKIDFSFLKHCQMIHDDIGFGKKGYPYKKSFAHTFLQNLKPIMYMYTTKEKQRNK